MKLILTDTSRGYSWSNEHRYYLCDSMEEYEQLEKKMQEKRANGNRTMWKDSCISCTPHTEVSDGVATYGGHKLRASGITEEHPSRGLSTDYTSYDHYIKPGTIEQNETVKTETWWT